MRPICGNNKLKQGDLFNDFHPVITILDIRDIYIKDSDGLNKTITNYFYY
jgi:hypothetical protein